MSLVPSPIESLSILIGLVCLGYVLFGIHTVWRFEQIGVRALGLFCVLWGLNFIVSAAVIYLLFTAGFTSGTALYGLEFSPPVELFMIASNPVRSLLTIGSIFSWFWFVYEYTTQTRKRDELIIVGLSLGLVALSTGTGLVGALTSFGYIQLPEVLVESEFFQFTSLLEIIGTGVAIGAGTAQLFRTTRRHPPFVRGAAVGLTVPVLGPYLIRYLYQWGLVPGFLPIQTLRLIALSAGLAGLYLAVHRYDLFDQLPAAQAMGRETSFDTTSAAITVLDDDNRVSDMNMAAQELFETSDAEAIGRPITDVLPVDIEQDRLLDANRLTFELPDTGTVVEAESTVTTDDRDREFGRVVSYTDITEERRRQQRIQVLNRVLRHNLRNRLMVVDGYVDVLAEEPEPDEEHVSTVNRVLDELVSMGAKAGKIEKLLQADREMDEPQSLREIAQKALTEVEKDHDTDTVAVAVPDGVTTTANPFLLEAILTELVINAIEHTDGADITIELTDDETGIVVRDTGPGIPQDEIEVFVTGEETPLQHGSGLGLWLVKWGVGRLGGNLEFETDEAGTTITVTLPATLLGRDDAPTATA